MSNRSNAAALNSRRTPLLKPAAIPDGREELPLAASARLNRRERCTDFHFLDSRAQNGAPLRATAPCIAVIAPGSSGNAITGSVTTAPLTTASLTTASLTTASTATTFSSTEIPAKDIESLLSPAPPDDHAMELTSTAPNTWTAPLQRTLRWQVNARYLLSHADQLRRRFRAAQSATTPKLQKAGRKVVYSERGLCKRVDRLLSARHATCIHFDSVTKTFTLPTVLARARRVAIKLDANGVGRERFLNEVLPALAAINTGCVVVLVARKNGLGPSDIQALVDVMKRNAVVYRLDLADNLLCTNEEPCQPLVELFQLVGPTSHVYLSNCGVNGATARQIADALPANPCISHLDLRGNAIDKSAVVHLAQAAGRSSLLALRLQGNDFDEKDEVVMRAVDAANLLRSGRPEDDEIIIRLPVVQTSVVDAITMLDESLCDLVQQLLDAAAAREQL
jgi:hypothetical protein